MLCKSRDDYIRQIFFYCYYMSIIPKFINYVTVIKSTTDPTKLQFYTNDVFTHISKEIIETINRIQSGSEKVPTNCSSNDVVYDDLNKLFETLGLKSNQIERATFANYQQLLKDFKLAPVDFTKQFVLSINDNDLELTISSTIDMIKSTIVEIDNLLNLFSSYVYDNKLSNSDIMPDLMHVNNLLTMSRDKLVVVRTGLTDTCSVNDIGSILALVMPDYFKTSFVQKLEKLHSDYLVPKQEGGDIYFNKYIQYLTKYNTMLDYLNSIGVPLQTGGEIGDHIAILEHKKKEYQQIRSTCTSKIISNILDTIIFALRSFAKNLNSTNQDTGNIRTTLTMLLELYNMLESIVNTDGDVCTDYTMALNMTSGNDLFQLTKSPSAKLVADQIESLHSYLITDSPQLLMRMDDVNDFVKYKNVGTYMLCLIAILKIQIVSRISMKRSLAPLIFEISLDEIQDELWTYVIFHKQNDRFDGEMNTNLAYYKLSDIDIRELKKIGKNARDELIPSDARPGIDEELLSLLYDKAVVELPEVDRCTTKYELSERLKGCITSVRKFKEAYDVIHK